MVTKIVAKWMIGREVSNRDVLNDYDLEALNPQYQYDHKQMVVGEIPLIGNVLPLFILNDLG